MTGQFSEINPEQCEHYARFMSHLNLPQANAIFWLLFALVLILMCISSLQHHKSISLMDIEKGLPTAANPNCLRKRHRRLRLHYLSIVCLCFVISVLCTVFECFALFNIEYCDGEDLMQLYWGFWSVLQVGSLIAILGVAVQFWIVLGNVETPSWAVALGTPVLVFAALGWIFRQIGKRMWYRFTGRVYETDESDSEDEKNNEDGTTERVGVERWLSRAPTIVAGRNNSTASSSRLMADNGSPRPNKELQRMSTC